MTREEKAKAYDEAIERYKAKQEYESQKVHEFIEYLFPELKESEDERIRREMIFYFQEEIPQCSIQEHADKMKKFISWLEKQGEHKKFRDGIQVGGKVTRNRDGMLVNLSQLNRVAKKDENQGEQKSADKVAPKFKVGDTVKDPYGDLYHITEITNDSYKTDDGRFILFENQEVYTLSNFTAWSEGDEMMLECVLDKIGDLGTGEMCKEWLKSLKERHTWKPSEEQVDALETAVSSLQSTALESLYNELKKL